MTKYVIIDNLKCCGCRWHFVWRADPNAHRCMYPITTMYDCQNRQIVRIKEEAE